MTIAPMDPREAHLRVWALIESGLESNADWREMFLGYGLLATVGFEQPFDQDDEKVRELAGQLDLPAVPGGDVERPRGCIMHQLQLGVLSGRDGAVVVQDLHRWDCPQQSLGCCGLQPM